ncbi:MAG TPA: catalase family peroxidase [Gemmatimonadaceae bacterium]
MARRTKAKSINAPRQTSTPAELVDALNLLFGKQTIGRAIHAKGIILSGRFTPTPDAARISKAPHFHEAVSLTARFSNFAGRLDVADTDPLASPRGLSLKFHLPDGSDTDLVAHSFNGFPVATADQFREFVTALARSGPDARKPTPADLFFAAHPMAKAFLDEQPPPPVSYATLAYFGVNSFEFSNADGDSVFGRYRIEPDAGIQLLSTEDRERADHDYLFREIRERVAREPVRFRYRLQLADATDVIDDPSVAWPENRRVVDLGTIELTEIAPDNAAAETALLFQPGPLPDGIAPADPMLQAREDSYKVSFERRHR